MDKRMVMLRRICGFFYTGNILLLITEFMLTLLSHKPLTVLQLMIFWLIMAAVFLIRDRMPNILCQFLVHAAGGVIVYFAIGDTYVRWFFILLLFVLFIHASDYILRGYTAKPVGDMPWPVFLLAVTATGYGMYLKNSFLIRVGYIIPLILFLLYLVMMYLDGMEKYVNATKNVSSIPRKKMLHANSILIGGILLSALLMIVLINALGFGDSLMRLGAWLKNVLRVGVLGFAAALKFLYHFLVDGSYEMPQEKTKQISRSASKAVKGMNSLDVILKLIIVALAAYVLLRVIRGLMRVFLRRHRNENETAERIVRVKKKEKEGREKIGRRYVLGNTPEEKLRWLYKKKILARKSYYQPKETDTTEMIAEKLRENDPTVSEEELRLLTESYRNVRYGNHVPDREELRNLRRLLR